MSPVSRQISLRHRHSSPGAAIDELPVQNLPSVNIPFIARQHGLDTLRQPRYERRSK